MKEKQKTIKKGEFSPYYIEMGVNMQYQNCLTGIFVIRLNRFVAQVQLNGEIVHVHVKNTGRCQELLVPGATVIVEKAENKSRKTGYSLIAVYKETMLVNIDSQAPNAVCSEALMNGKITEIGPVVSCKREVRFGNSRFDLFYETKEKKGFIEVKGVTLEKAGNVCFPDAPTERGQRHIEEMRQAVKQGYEGNLLFLVQLRPAKQFIPNWKTDRPFAEALLKAEKEGVRILVYDSIVTETSIEIGKNIPFLLEKSCYFE